MSKPVITVENLSKSYLLRHQQSADNYTTLRDMLAHIGREKYCSRLVPGIYLLSNFEP